MVTVRQKSDLVLKQKILLTNCLLSRTEQDTSHKWYMWHGVLAGNLTLVYMYMHNFVVLSLFVVLICSSMNFDPAYRQV